MVTIYKYYSCLPHIEVEVLNSIGRILEQHDLNKPVYRLYKESYLYDQHKRVNDVLRFFL